MQITQSIDLNLSIDGIHPKLHMPQGDSNTRAIVAALWDGAQPYNIPTDSAVMVRFRKPDGTGGLYDTTEAGSKVTFSGNTVTAPVATQMLAVPGIVMAEINVYAPSSYVPTNSRGDVDGDGVVTQDDLKMLAYHLSGTQPLEDASNADANGDGVIDAKDLTYMSQQLDKAAKQLSSFAFSLCVAPCVYTDAFIISSDYYNILSADIAKVLAIETYPPIIGENGNWFFWDANAKKYTDTGKTAKGTDGITPHIGANGNWYLGTTDTGKPSRGATGATGVKGEKGDPGKDGTNGITPTIGANGNWFLGTTDTNKPSRGATGAKGDPGDDYVLTSADKSEIAALVLAEIPNGDEVAYG